MRFYGKTEFSFQILSTHYNLQQFRCTYMTLNDIIYAIRLFTGVPIPAPCAVRKNRLKRSRISVNLT